MKKNHIFMVMAAILLIVLSACGSAVNTTGSKLDQVSRTISVNGSGKVYLAPDVAYVYIGVHTEADTVTDALNQNSAQASAVASSLKELGVEDKDIQTSSFNVYPYQTYSQTGEMTGTKYVVDNTVYVTIRDLASLGKMLDVVVQSGANTINSISFDVLDKTEAISEARKLAVADARKQAEEIALAAGVELGELQYITVYNSYSSPSPYYGYGGGKAEGVMTVPVSTGQVLVSAESNLSYSIK